MVIPSQARKRARIDRGDRLDVQIEGDGRILLVRLERPKEAPPVPVKIQLAASREMKLATFDSGIKHAAVEVIR
jgi:bifunctional DNA-binding transcriptional regulator/antitoxin component of YhaV-PrlF toxin-antitoxin module